MPKATKEKLGEQSARAAGATDNQPVEGAEAKSNAEGKPKEGQLSVAEELAEVIRQKEKAQSELESIKTGRAVEEAKLAKIREDIRAEKAVRGQWSDPQPVAPAPQSAPTSQQPSVGGEDLGTVEGWQRHIAKLAEEKVSPVKSELDALRQSSQRKAIRSFMSRHPDYRSGDETRLKELMDTANRNGLSQAFQSEDAEEILEGSWAYINRQEVLEQSRATGREKAEAEAALAESAIVGSVGRQAAAGEGAMASKEDERIADLVKMPIDKYLKLKTQAQVEGIWPVGAPPAIG